MKRIIRKALWSWQDWKNRRKFPNETRQRRRSIRMARKQHGKSSLLVKEQRNQMNELLRAGK
jgi:ribosomal protein S21